MTTLNESIVPADKIKRRFRISEEPVIAIPLPEEAPPPDQSVSDLGELPVSYGVDLLYVIARDPYSLFLYWDIDWERVFGKANLSPREIHLRVLREDGTEETTVALDPAAGSYFAEVGASDARYVCELGCFDAAEWKSLIRSAATSTPAAKMSSDVSADFATLPFHLSFQRLLEIFRATGPRRKTLALAISDIQQKVRVLRQSMAPSEWTQIVEFAVASVASEAGLGFTGMSATELTALLPAEEPEQSEPPAEMMERWEQLAEQSLGASWSGGSSLGLA